MNYALLVGINNYRSPLIADLNGCENDVQSISGYLEDRFGDSIQIKKLLSLEATRKHIIAGFREHLGKAKKGEFAFFYFSGHGCQEPSPEEFWKVQSEQKHENIVVADSLEGADDLADKEVSLLIQELAQNHPEIVVIFDCCHSGSGTRSKTERIRMDSPRPAMRNQANFLEGTFENLGKRAPRHIFLSACHQTELSREQPMGPEQKWGGFFTNIMLQILRQTERNGHISYANLIWACRMTINRRLKGNKQTPQIDAMGEFDPDSLFLQTATEQANLMSLILDSKGKWKVNQGRIHGLTGTNQARFAVYANQMLDSYKGEAITTEIGLYDSTLQLPSSYTPRSKNIPFVRPISLPIDKLSVWIPAGQHDVFNQELSQLKALSIQENNSPLLQMFQAAISICSLPELADYGLLIEQSQYRLVDTETQTDLVSGIPLSRNSDKQAADFSKILLGLNHIAKWERIKQLRNPHPLSQRFAERSSSIQLLFENTSLREKNQGEDITVDCEGAVGFRLSVQNSGESPIHCTCLYLSRYWQIQEISSLTIVNDDLYKQIDQDQFFIPDAPDLFQITERYTIVLSKKSLPFLNVNSSKKLQEVLGGLRLSMDKKEEKNPKLIPGLPDLFGSSY